MTYTYAVLEITPCAYKEIREKLAEAGYSHAFHREDGREVTDMHGIALTAPPIPDLASGHDCGPDTCACFRRGLESTLIIRCSRHYGVPKQNRSALGGECGACIAEQRDELLAALKEAKSITQ